MMRKFLIFTFLRIAKAFRDLMSNSNTSYLLLFKPGFENLRWKIGMWKAWRVFDLASKNTPAYQKFLKNAGFSSLKISGLTPLLSEVPATDKANYVKKFTIEDRCVGGKFPSGGVMIDESSGTSGTPNNWVRGNAERLAVKKALQVAMHTVVGKKQVFIINAFALGPWATGMNVSISFVDVAILKSVGPDIKKIENTLNLFGSKYEYVIMGYPPFLKNLVDNANVNWSKFNIIAVFGGEGLSEGMRDYLAKHFSKVIGSYGASDLEINIAAENEFTISLRKLMLENEELKNRLVRVDSKNLPMIFQYNPLDYYIESNEQGELIITLCRDSNISPKVRYNIHDTGHVIRYPELLKILKELKIPLSKLEKSFTDLPLLFHYGRSDMAVAFFGCKITPQDIQQTIYSMPKLAKVINSFSMITYEDERINKKLTLALEFTEGLKIPKNLDEKELAVQLFKKLQEVNQDYREIAGIVPKASTPIIELYEYGQGPFAINDIRLKQNYIQKR